MTIGEYLNGKRFVLYSSVEKKLYIKELEKILEKMYGTKGTVFFSHKHCLKKHKYEAEGTVRHRKWLFGLIDYYEIIGDDGKVLERFTIDELFAAYINKLCTLPKIEDEDEEEDS